MTIEEIEEDLFIKKRLQLSENFFIEFSGDDTCDDTCQGWDMESTRCDCGNRRVRWNIHGYGKESEALTIEDVYAEAY